MAFLTTKHYIPPVRLDLVSRPRLVERLNAGMDGKLTLVSAPAGYGKTTLLGEWIYQGGDGMAPSLPVAWLSLDEADNHPARFLSYLIGAAQKIVPDIGRDLLGALQSPQPPPTETVLVSLINELASIPHDCTRCCLLGLVLDDYHLVENQEIHQAVAFLLDRLPPPPEGLHLVIATRKDPLLPLARWRVGAQMTEVREADLRFTHDEATAFLGRAMGLDLSNRDVVILETRTEGWIAGLQLAALSIQGMDATDTASFISAFSGDDRHIVDYLVDEVLAHRPRGTKRFLLQTSILERMSGPLCDTVTGGDEGQRVLEMLEQANLFVVPLDNRRQWYRYHHMFADLLRHRLRAAAGASGLTSLHVRASEWYELNGFVADAVHHALAAEDLPRAARLVEQVGFEMLTRSEWGPLSSWLDAMPQEFVRTRPWLCIYQAWMVRRAGRLDAVAQLVQDAERALETTAASIPATEQDLIQGNLASLCAYVAFGQGDLQRAIECAHQALECFPPGYIIRGVTGLILGIASRKSGDLAAALQAYAGARRMGQASGNDFLTQIAIWETGYIQLLQGQLYQAVDTYCDALHLASELGERRSQFAGQPYVYVGDILREWNELEAAVVYLTQGIELCEPGRLLDALTDGYIALACVRLAQGDLDGALRACQDAERTLQVPNPDPVRVVRVDDCMARLWLAQDDPSAAKRWVQECGLRVDDELDYKRELEHITLARVLIALGAEEPEAPYLADALSLLARLLEMAESAGWMGKAVEILVLQALALYHQDAHQAQGNVDEALGALARALSIAEPEGYVRTFLDEGPAMASLLREAAARGIAPDYVRKLLAAFGEATTDHGRGVCPEPAKGTHNREPAPSSLKEPALSLPKGRTAEPTASSFVHRPSSALLVEPLSERELEVLQLIAEGLSNPEIAQRLFLALNTVKVHTRNIYGKLDVHNRTRAVTRARELDLL